VILGIFTFFFNQEGFLGIIWNTGSKMNFFKCNLKCNLNVFNLKCPFGKTQFICVRAVLSVCEGHIKQVFF